ncbi:unnamed protein product, partial [Mesorhabditis spiculigera]
MRRLIHGLFSILICVSVIRADAPECEEKTLGTKYIEDYVQFQCNQTSDMIGYVPIGCAPNNSAAGPVIPLNGEYLSPHFVFKCLSEKVDGYTEVEYAITHCLDEHGGRIDIGETYSDPANTEGQDTVIECTKLENGAVRKTVLKSTYCEDSKGMQKADGAVWAQDPPKEANKTLQSGVQVQCQNQGKYLKGVQIACIAYNRQVIPVGQKKKVDDQWMECVKRGKSEKGYRAVLEAVGSKIAKTPRARKLELYTLVYVDDKPQFCSGSAGLVDFQDKKGCTMANGTLVHFGVEFVEDGVKQLCNFTLNGAKATAEGKPIACLYDGKEIEVGGQVMVGREGKKCVIKDKKCQLIDMTKDEVEKYMAGRGKETSFVAQRSGRVRGPRMKPKVLKPVKKDGGVAGFSDVGDKGEAQN